MSPYGTATPEDAAEQLFERAETGFAQHFPGKKVTQIFERYRYRYYPETKQYVGVAVNVVPGDGLLEGGVYVLGGAFGNVPMLVGPLTNFITPMKPRYYTDKVYALWTEKYPYAVTKTTVTRVENMTGRPRIAFCLIANRAELSGIILVLCKDFDALTWNVFYIDPLAETLHEYKGALRPDLAFTPTENGNRVYLTKDTGWIDLGLPDQTFPEWLTYAAVENGWYFVTVSNMMSLRFQDRSGITTIVKDGEFWTTGTVRTLSAYSSRVQSRD